jgi:hypothetical protein
MSHQSALIAHDIDEYLAQHERKELLRFITCGSVDDGKSTLIGRLFYESKMIYEDQLAAITRDSSRYGTTGGEVDLGGEPLESRGQILPEAGEHLPRLVAAIGRHEQPEQAARHPQVVGPEFRRAPQPLHGGGRVAPGEFEVGEELLHRRPARTIHFRGREQVANLGEPFPVLLLGDDPGAAPAARPFEQYRGGPRRPRLRARGADTAADLLRHLPRLGHLVLFAGQFEEGLDLDGDVVGINVAIRAGAQRIGFTIPIDDARRYIARLMNIERLGETYHGVVSHDEKRPGEFKMIIDSVEPNSPAATADFSAS